MTFLILSADVSRGRCLAARLTELDPDSLCLALPASAWEAALREVLMDGIVCPGDSPLLRLPSHPYAVPWPTNPFSDAWVRSLLRPGTPEVTL